MKENKMPLKSGKNAIGSNIAELINSGYPPKQAEAIAYSKSGEGKDTESKRVTDINNWIKIKDNPITKVGVFPYSGRQIDPEGENPEIDPDAVYQVYRPEEELTDPQCIESFKLIPWTDEHAMLGSEEEGLLPPEQKGIQGVIGEEVYFKDGYLKANIKVFSEKLKKLIDNGKTELSIGYRCSYDIIRGVYEGIKYDFIQRNIRGNHLALVDEGRAGPDVAVLDHFKFTFDSTEIIDMPKAGVAHDEYEDKTEETKDEAPTAPTLESLAKDIGEMKEFIKGFRTSQDEVPDPEGALDADEDKDKEKDAKDEEAEKKDDKKDGMDSQLKSLRKEVQNIKKNGIKTYMSEISKRNVLAQNLSNHIGTFVYDDKTLDEVASYGVEKLGLQCEEGQEHAVLSGYFAGKNQNYVAQNFSGAFDSKHKSSSLIDDYLKGDK